MVLNSNMGKLVEAVEDIQHQKETISKNSVVKQVLETENKEKL